MEIKNIGGRPQKGTAKKKAKVYLRVSADEKIILKEFAKNSGISVSEFVRKKALNHKIKTKEIFKYSDADLKEIEHLSTYHIHFRRIGNLIKNKSEFREINKQVVEVAEMIKTYLKNKHYDRIREDD